MSKANEIDVALYTDAKLAYEQACAAGTKGMSPGQWYRLSLRLETIAGQFPVNAHGDAMRTALVDRAKDCFARFTRLTSASENGMSLSPTEKR